jgi:ribosomal protein S28E/S33
MALPFTTGTLDATGRGGAVTYTTSADQVEELRRRVRALADAHNARHASRAVVEPVAGGARLVLSAEGAEAERLREALLAAGDYLRRQGCELQAAAAL